MTSDNETAQLHLYSEHQESASQTTRLLLHYTPCIRFSFQVHVKHRTQFFTGRMPFLPLNQQRQSTEGTSCRISSSPLGTPTCHGFSKTGKERLAYYSPKI